MQNSVDIDYKLYAVTY